MFRLVYTVPSGANGDNLRRPWSYTGPDSLQGADLSEQIGTSKGVYDKELPSKASKARPPILVRPPTVGTLHWRTTVKHIPH